MFALVETCVACSTIPASPPPPPPPIPSSLVFVKAPRPTHASDAQSVLVAQGLPKLILCLILCYS